MLNAQDLETQIKKTQALIRNWRKIMLKNRNLNALAKIKYNHLIHSAKQKINTLLQEQDDWFSIEYSQARYIPSKKRNY